METLTLAMVDSIPLLLPMGILAALVTFLRRDVLARKFQAFLAHWRLRNQQRLRARSNRLTHSRLGRRA